MCFLSKTFSFRFALAFPLSLTLIAIVSVVVPKLYSLRTPPQIHDHVKLPFSTQVVGGLIIDCGFHSHHGYPWKLILPANYTMLESFRVFLGSVLNMGKLVYCWEVVEFPIHNARESDLINSDNTDLTFEEDGFTLIDMQNTSYDYLDWYHYSMEDVSEFTDRMEAEIKKLHNSSNLSFEWHPEFIVRGTDADEGMYLNVNSHSDVFHNATEQKLYNYPKRYTDFFFNYTDKYKVFGIWKPIYMTTPICDNPLVLLSAKGYRPETDEVPLYTDFYDMKRNGLGHIKAIVGLQKYHGNRHKWFSYPGMTTNEVLLFTHYTHSEWGSSMSNPHFSFTNRSCEGKEPRRSVEFRVKVFKKE